MDHSKPKQKPSIGKEAVKSRELIDEALERAKKKGDASLRGWLPEAIKICEERGIKQID